MAFHQLNFSEVGPSDLSCDLKKNLPTIYEITTFNMKKIYKNHFHTHALYDIDINFYSSSSIIWEKEKLTINITQQILLQLDTYLMLLT